MSGLTGKLRSADLPSEAAIAVAHDGLGQGATRREAYRQLLVVDAPAILRVLLEEASGEIDLGNIWYTVARLTEAYHANDEAAAQAALLDLLAPKATA